MNSISLSASRKSAPALWWGWMLALCLVAIIGGFLMAFSPSTLYGTIIRENYNAFFNHDAFSSLPSGELAFVHWIYGVAGAFTVGWFVVLGWIIFSHLRAGKKWAWQVVAVSITAKGLINLFVAVKSGYHLDINGQIAYLVGFWIPLLATYRYMDHSSAIGLSAVH